MQEVRSALRPRERLQVSEWADRYRVLGDESPEPGPWRTSRRPFLREVMDTFSSRETNVLVTVFANQLGKTEILNNCIGWASDQAPGPMMLTFDSEDTGKRHVKTRLHKMFQSSPQLRGNIKELGTKIIELRTCNIVVAWSGSSGSMASTPCRYVFADEIDSWETYSEEQSHGSPVAQCEVRVRAFGEIGKQYYSGTPTTEEAYLWPLFQTTDRRRYWVPCPHCGRHQILIFERLKWEKGKDPLEIVDRRLAWMECEHCQGEIRDNNKAKMLAGGVWAPHGCRVVDGEIVGNRPPAWRAGFHLSVLYSEQLSFSRVAAKYLAAIGDDGEMHNFYNLFLAEPYRRKVESVAERGIRKAARGYKRGTVPDDCQRLIAGIDVQQDHFWYVVRGWGQKEKSALVDWGRLETWQDLTTLARRVFPRSGGGQMGLDLILIDAGYEPAKVHDWQRAHGPLVRATKGSDSPALRLNISHSSPRPGWLLWTFKANFFKDNLAKHINSRPDLNDRGEPTGEWWGEWTIPSEIDEEYVRQMTSERREWIRKRGRRYCVWSPKTETTPNHLWDCEVLCEVGAELLLVRFLHVPIDAPAAPAAPKGTAAEAGRSPPEDWLEADGFLEGGDGWLDPG